MPQDTQLVSGKTSIPTPASPDLPDTEAGNDDVEGREMDPNYPELEGVFIALHFHSQRCLSVEMFQI